MFGNYAVDLLFGSLFDILGVLLLLDNLEALLLFDRLCWYSLV